MEVDEYFIETLIEGVEQHKCLYWKLDPNYFNKKEKHNAWESISQICGRSDEECKRRWTLLRERYTKEIRKEELNLKKGYYFQERWKYADRMEFLRDSLGTPRSRRDSNSIKVELTTISGLDFSNLIDEEDYFNETLIENVEQHKCLYSKLDENYCNKIERSNAWEQISKNCGRSVEDCKHNWKLLRDSFVKEIKKEETQFGKGYNIHEKWKYADQMEFLRDSLASRRARHNSNSSEGNFSQDSDLSNSAPPAKKRNTDIGSLCEQIRGTIATLEKSLLEPGPMPTPTPTPEQTVADEAFWKLVSDMTNPLPESIKDDLKEEILRLVFAAKKKASNF